MKRAMRKAVKPLVASAKALAPVRTRSLRTAIGSKVDTKKAGNVTFGVVGIRSKYTKKNKQPSRYGHIIEFGSKKIAPRKFLAPALARHKQEFFAIMKNVVAQELKAL
jgi:HK97 gp10 family phage protein